MIIPNSYVHSHRPVRCDLLPLELQVVLATAVVLVYPSASGVVQLSRFRLRDFQRNTLCPLRGLPPTHTQVGFTIRRARCRANKLSPLSV
jgi:hypothetical protein